MLAWLLNPKGDHTLRDELLISFLGYFDINLESEDQIEVAEEPWLEEKTLRGRIPDIKIETQHYFISALELSKLKETEDIIEADVIREKIPISLKEPVNWREVGLDLAEALIKHIRTYYPDLRKLF